MARPNRTGVVLVQKYKGSGVIKSIVSPEDHNDHQRKVSCSIDIVRLESSNGGGMACLAARRSWGGNCAQQHTDGSRRIQRVFPHLTYSTFILRLICLNN